MPQARSAKTEPSFASFKRISWKHAVDLLVGHVVGGNHPSVGG